jgi:hypothetical protein
VKQKTKERDKGQNRYVQVGGRDEEEEEEEEKEEEEEEEEEEPRFVFSQCRGEIPKREFLFALFDTKSCSVSSLRIHVYITTVSYTRNPIQGTANINRLF